MACEVWRYGCLDDEPDEGSGGREPTIEADVCRLEHASRPAEGSSRKKMTRPSQRRELAEKAVAQRGVSIALACRTFGVSETCYRYSPQRNADNDEIADLLLGLVRVKKTWGGVLASSFGGSHRSRRCRGPRIVSCGVANRGCQVDRRGRRRSGAWC